MTAAAAASAAALLTLEQMRRRMQPSKTTLKWRHGARYAGISSASIRISAMSMHLLLLVLLSKSRSGFLLVLWHGHLRVHPSDKHHGLHGSSCTMEEDASQLVCACAGAEAGAREGHAEIRAVIATHPQPFPSAAGSCGGLLIENNCKAILVDDCA